MDQLKISYEGAGYSVNELGKKLKELTRVQESLNKASKAAYTTPFGFVNLAADSSLQEQVLKLVKEKQKLSIDLLLLIGIGGSSLGATALIEAIYGKFYNFTEAIKFYCADTIDPVFVSEIKRFIENFLKQKKRLLIVLVSKSGTTTETLVNGAIFYESLKKYYPDDYKNYLMVISDQDSALFKWATAENISYLLIPKLVGGRYSVLSAAGLFPLAFLGIDIIELLRGAQLIFDQSKNLDMHNNAALSALALFDYYQKGFTIHDFFIFAVSYQGLGAWYRQLVGESLGKDGKGFTPTVSMGTVDLHSVAQLYLAGPHNKITSFISIESQEKNNQDIIPNSPFDVSGLFTGKSLNEVWKAILEGVLAAYRQQKRPYLHIKFAQNSLFALGEFIALKMLETVYLAELLKVDAFDQPEVELYKIETKRRLLNL